MIELLDKKDYSKILELGKLINENFSLDKIGINDQIMVYKEKNKYVGFLQFSKLYETVDILNIAVLSDYRRKGIATALISELLKLDGISHIMLEVRENNIVAISFYEHLGFKKLRTIKNYYGNVDAIAMERLI